MRFCRVKTPKVCSGFSQFRYTPWTGGAPGLFQVFSWDPANSRSRRENWGAGGIKLKQNRAQSTLIFMEETEFQGETDAGLVAKSLQGNEKAFRQLVERYQPMAFSVVRGVLGDRDDAEDVLQNVFIKVFRGLRGFRGDAKLSTWIYRIARNEAVNAARKPELSGPSVDDIDLPASGQRPPAASRALPWRIAGELSRRSRAPVYG
jgi:hypothetical protein